MAQLWQIIVNIACERELASCLRSIAADVDGVTAMDGMRFERGSDTLPGAVTSQWCGKEKWEGGGRKLNIHTALCYTE
jgi:hypothetical protein